MTDRAHSSMYPLTAIIYSNGMVELESERFKGVGIEIRFADPTDHTRVPPDKEGALYRLETYRPNKDHKGVLGGVAWVMPDGSITPH